MKKIGLTTTVPVEVLLAAGYKPIDLNNIFITDEDHKKYIDIAERDGFPKSLCAWIKGIYGVCIDKGIKEIVGVTEGDCSNTKGLIEVLGLKGIKVHPFGFPHSHKMKDLKIQIDDLMDRFNVTIDEVEKVRQEINEVRKLGIEIDRLTYEDLKVSGFENHLYEVSFSDLWGDINIFREELKNRIDEYKKRKKFNKVLRIGYIGVPPMTADLYDFVEEQDGLIVYNEVQREFAFPRAHEAKDIYEQYYDYTYVYDVNFRIKELKRQIDIRKLDGIIHYTQAFCYRAIEDIVLKEKLDIPILNIEGDTSNKLDERTKLRLEAFLDMLKDLKE
ncbi:2-hydroxyacyl-CoA dehydratase family protein [Anaeromicrobium sediminis]|uniref:2-hydroxyglutaryl-CoA dehydratase n=1 Tax=Anaeromicrobium sediminis TaxID=1478221 RepID=A0A267MCZ8_9FIRM|nr:2-hydroxyacyl-CoA dehydratase [Anaeromicrobium sediminis]PAB56798.1 2-hydroxyglutaryl-CoA dehydratase [Anaeromicrobium sediminis]